jgi:hypothetical protein
MSPQLYSFWLSHASVTTPEPIDSPSRFSQTPDLRLSTARCVRFCIKYSCNQIERGKKKEREREGGGGRGGLMKTIAKLNDDKKN